MSELPAATSGDPARLQHPLIPRDGGGLPAAPGRRRHDREDSKGISSNSVRGREWSPGGEGRRPDPEGGQLPLERHLKDRRSSNSDRGSRLSRQRVGNRNRGGLSRSRVPGENLKEPNRSWSAEETTTGRATPGLSALNREGRRGLRARSAPNRDSRREP